jgi:hypothetical protein
MATLLQPGLSSVTTLAVVAGVLIAVLAVGSFAYQLASDRSTDEGDANGVRHGDDDDEWDYY